MHMKSIEYLNSRVYYWKSGIPGNSPLVLIHGAGGDHKLFHHQIRELSRENLIIAPDLPGHGLSKAAQVASLQSLAGAIEAICYAEGLSSIIPVGHSMGGAIALELYKNKPELVRAFIMISTAPRLPVSPAVFELIDKNFNAFCDFLTRFSFSPAASADIIQLSVKTLLDTGKEVIENDFRICAESDHNMLIPHVMVPLLAIANRNDKMMPASHTEEFSKIPGKSKIIIYESGGHMPQVENASAVNRDIRDFLSKL